MTKFVGTLNIPSLASAPGTALEGDLYYNTTTDKVNFYNGIAWVEVGAGAGNKVYYQTSEPTGGTYATGDIWIDSDSALGGPISLTDSANSTSISTAATPNSVLQSMKNYQIAAYNSTTRIANMPNWYITTTSLPPSGTVVYTRLIAERNFTVSNIAWSCGVFASGLSLCRFGIYTRSGTTFTLVARTASDNLIFNASNTRFERALATTGGYPATYDFVAGSEYFLAVIQVASASTAQLAAGAVGTTLSAAITGQFSYTQGAQADLPATGTGSVSNVRFYAEVS